MKKILVCGSRDWTDFIRVQDIIREHANCPIYDTMIVHGGARGADRQAHLAAQRLKMQIKVYKANWDAQGKAAGPIRNQRMLDEEKPDLVIAFHKDGSRGTQDMIDRATRAGVPVRVYLPLDNQD